MGNDGGSIETRRELVKQKKKKIKIKSRDLICSITKQPLKQSFVICHKGRFYNKEDLLKSMIDKQSHIKSLKQIKTVNENCYQHNDEVKKLFCPYSLVEFKGSNLIFLFKCGCLINKNLINIVNETISCPFCLTINKIPDDYIEFNKENSEIPNKKIDNKESNIDLSLIERKEN